MDQTQPQKSAAEKRADLNRLLQQANVPTLPIVAQKLVELCKDDRANFAHFARIIESDQGLASRILRVVNSAYYGLRQKVTSLDRAISILGLKYIKSISLGFHLATALSKFVEAGFDMAEFWRQSLLRGVIARRLAGTYCPARQDEAFLVGLLQDCGIPFLVQALGEKYARLWSNCRTSQAALFKLEKEVFEYDHLTAASIITEQWSLPELLAVPIRTHHRRSQSQPSMAEEVQLCQIAYFVGTLSLNNPASLCDEDLTFLNYCQNAFGLGRSDMLKLLEQSQQEFVSISQMFSEVLKNQTDVTVLLSQCRDLLSDLAGEANRKIIDLQSEIERLESQCRKLTHSAEFYRQRSEVDSLTGLATRNSLETFLEQACASTRNDNISLTLLFIDIDNFNIINERYGHVIGDQVLQLLAQFLQGFFNNKCHVCRYGGDEIIAILQGLEARQATKLTEGLLNPIRQLKVPVIPADESNVPALTCSIGMVFCEPGSIIAPTRILELADNQMYQAKRNGKNNYRFQIIPAPSSPAPKK